MTRAQHVVKPARQRKESGNKDWGECINQAYAEIPPDASRTASIANDASRQAILGRKNAARDEFIRAVHSDMEKNGEGLPGRVCVGRENSRDSVQRHESDCPTSARKDVGGHKLFRRPGLSRAWQFSDAPNPALAQIALRCGDKRDQWGGLLMV